MAFDEKVADRVRGSLARRRGVTEKWMFGGLAFMVHSNMCCGVLGDDLVVRVGAEAHDAALARPHTRVMDFTRKPMRGATSTSGRKPRPRWKHGSGVGFPSLLRCRASNPAT